MTIKTQEEYINWVKDIKQKISKAQIKASISVNTEMIILYLSIGKSISDKLNKSKWGNFIVEQLSIELKQTFINEKGFSERNLFYMKKIYEFYALYNAPDINNEQLVRQIGNSEIKVQQLVAQIPWGHNILIITKIKNIIEAIFYIKETIKNNWSGLYWNIK